MTTRISIVTADDTDRLASKINGELRNIEEHLAVTVIDVDIQAVALECSAPRVQWIGVITWMLLDREIRDLANSMAEDEESDRQAAEQAAADDADGRDRAAQEDSAAGEYQNIEDIPY